MARRAPSGRRFQTVRRAGGTNRIAPSGQEGLGRLGGRRAFSNMLNDQEGPSSEEERGGQERGEWLGELDQPGRRAEQPGDIE